MKTLIVDLNNIAFVTRFGALKGQKDNRFVMEVITKETIGAILNAAKVTKSDSIVIACDSKNVWRRDIYPMYKEGRDIKDDKFFQQTIDAIGKVKEFFDDYTAAKVIQVDRTEADDIIAVWCGATDNETVIFSTDKDFVQLIDDKTSLYNPTKKDYRTSDDPAFDLFVKCIRGDSSDAIRSAFPRVRLNKLEEAWTDPYKMSNIMETIRKDGKKVSEVYDFNKKLIDMDMIPDEICERIFEAILSYTGNDSFSEVKAMRFFGELGLKSIGTLFDHKMSPLGNVPELG